MSEYNNESGNDTQKKTSKAVNVCGSFTELVISIPFLLVGLGLGIWAIVIYAQNAQPDSPGCSTHTLLSVLLALGILYVVSAAMTMVGNCLKFVESLLTRDGKSGVMGWCANCCKPCIGLAQLVLIIVLMVLLYGQQCSTASPDVYTQVNIFVVISLCISVGLCVIGICFACCAVTCGVCIAGLIGVGGALSAMSDDNERQ